MSVRKALIVAPLYDPSHMTLSVPQLSGAVALLKRLPECLSKHGHYAVDIEFANSEKVNKSQLRKRLNEFFDAREGDELLFYFYGHGCLRSGSDMGIFVTCDAAPYDEGVAMNEVVQMAENTPAHEVILIFDCCHAGAALPATVESVPTRNLHRAGRSILAACAEHQEALETATEDHKILGLFSAQVLDALEGKATYGQSAVDVNFLVKYVNSHLKSWAQRPIANIIGASGASSFVITSGFATGVDQKAFAALYASCTRFINDMKQLKMLHDRFQELETTHRIIRNTYTRQYLKDNPQEWQNIRLLVEDTCLFTIDDEFASDLDQRVLSARLREKFQARGIALTVQAMVETIMTQKNWAIVDGNQKYFVRGELQGLDVFKSSPGMAHIIKQMLQIARTLQLTSQWVGNLSDVQSTLQCALGSPPDFEQLTTALNLLDSIIPRQSYINERLRVKGQDLLKLDLITELHKILDDVHKISKDIAATDKLTQQIYQVEARSHEMSRLINEHDLWQGLDDSLRLVDQTMIQMTEDAETNPELLESHYKMLKTQIEDNHKGIRRQIDKLCEGKSEYWAIEMKAALSKTSRSLAERNVEQAARAFDAFRSWATMRFIALDKELLEVCGNWLPVEVTALTQLLRYICGGEFLEMTPPQG